MRDEGAWLGTARTDGEKCVFSTDVCTGCWAGPRGEGPGCCDPPDCRPAEPQPSLWLGFDTVPDLVNSLFLKTLSGSFCRSHVEMAESDGDPSTALRATARLPAPGSGQPACACAQGPPVDFPARGTPALLDPPLPACPHPACSHVHTHAAHKYTQTCAHMHRRTAQTHMHLHAHTRAHTPMYKRARTRARTPCPAAFLLRPRRGAWRVVAAAVSHGGDASAPPGVFSGADVCLAAFHVLAAATAPNAPAFLIRLAGGRSPGAGAPLGVRSAAGRHLPASPPGVAPHRPPLHASSCRGLRPAWLPPAGPPRALCCSTRPRNPPGRARVVSWEGPTTLAPQGKPGHPLPSLPPAGAVVQASRPWLALPPEPCRRMVRSLPHSRKLLLP